MAALVASGLGSIGRQLMLVRSGDISLVMSLDFYQFTVILFGHWILSSGPDSTVPGAAGIGIDGREVCQRPGENLKDHWRYSH